MKRCALARNRTAAGRICALLALCAVVCVPHSSARALERAAGVRLAYHSFTESKMKACYSYAPMIVGELLVVRGRDGASLEIGYLSREGEPILLPSGWSVASTSLSMWAVPISLNYLRYLPPHGRAGTLAPYAGVGLGALIGGEKIGARAASLLKEWDGWVWAARGSIFGNLFLGARITASQWMDAVVEVRRTQGGKGWNADLSDEEGAAKLDEYLYPLVQRPGFDFTGWSVSIGLRW